MFTATHKSGATATFGTQSDLDHFFNAGASAADWTVAEVKQVEAHLHADAAAAVSTVEQHIPTLTERVETAIHNFETSVVDMLKPGATNG